MKDVVQQRSKYLFLLPVYNERKVLEKSVTLLATFLNSSSEFSDSSKVLILDNASTDGTGKIGKEMARRYQNVVEYVYIEEKGRGNALRFATSEYKSLYYL